MIEYLNDWIYHNSSRIPYRYVNNGENKNYLNLFKIKKWYHEMNDVLLNMHRVIYGWVIFYNISVSAKKIFTIFFFVYENKRLNVTHHSCFFRTLSCYFRSSYCFLFRFQLQLIICGFNHINIGSQFEGIFFWPRFQ